MLWVGFGIVTLLLIVLGAIAGLLAKRWLSSGPADARSRDRGGQDHPRDPGAPGHRARPARRGLTSAPTRPEEVCVLMPAEQPRADAALDREHPPGARVLGQRPALEGHRDHQLAPPACRTTARRRSWARRWPASWSAAAWPPPSPCSDAARRLGRRRLRAALRAAPGDPAGRSGSPGCEIVWGADRGWMPRSSAYSRSRDLDRGGHGHRHERAEHPEQRAPEEHRHHHQERVDVHRPLLDLRLDHVVLHLLVDDREDRPTRSWPWGSP